MTYPTTAPSKVAYVDIETDGLNPSKIWCVCVLYNGIARTALNKQSLLDIITTLPSDVTYVGHNFIRFDYPVIERLWGIKLDPVVDTLTMSRLLYPLMQSHSLRAWGEELGFPKGDHDDWTQLTAAMLTYCEKDTRVTEALYKQLAGVATSTGQWNSVYLEHDVAWAVAQQERNGWFLDQRLCTHLLAEFTQEMSTIEMDFQAMFPPIIEERISAKTGKVLKPKVTVFNPASRTQLAYRLAEKGAQWSRRTETGKPCVDEKALRENDSIPECAVALRYLLLQKRKAQIASWLEHVQDDGRVHGTVNTNGAVTGRMTHSKPNMAQVPATRAEYGEECRKCWTVPNTKTHAIVGADASGLELRMLAHYMADDTYTDELLNGDIHALNQKAAGLETRDQAKTFIYAFLYGGGDTLLGEIATGKASKHAGRKLKEAFLKNTPALANLRSRVEKAAQRGWLKGLDGRRLHVRSPHSALNTLLQSAGAVVMKQALIHFVEDADDIGLDYKLVGNIHDEIQMEVKVGQEEAVGKLAVASIKKAGETLGLNCPLDGEWKTGQTWADTH